MLNVTTRAACSGPHVAQALLIALLAWSPATAQPAPSAPGAPQTLPATQPASPGAVPSAPGVSEEQLTARIKEITGARDLSDAQRGQILDWYNRALEQARRGREFSGKADAFEQAVKDAPQRLKALEQAASQPATRAAVQPPEDMSLEQMEAKRKEVRLELADLRRQADDLKAQLKARVARRAELPKQAAAAKARLEKVREQRSQPAPPGASARLLEARRAYLQAAETACRAEIEACEKENATYETRGALLRAQQQAVAARLSRVAQQAQAWASAVRTRRREQAEQALAEAKRAEADAAGHHPAVRQVRKRSAALAETLAGKDGVLAKHAAARDALEAAQSRRSDLETEFERVKDLVAGEAAQSTVAEALAKLRAKLPDVKALRQRHDRRDAEIAQVKLKIPELEQRAQALSDVSAEAARIIAQAKPPVPPDRREQVSRRLRDALQDERTLVASAAKAYDAYYNALLELKAGTQALVDGAQEIADYDAQAPAASKKPPVAVPAAAKLTAESIDRRMKAALAAAGLDDETKKSVEQTYQQALEQVRRAGEAERNAQQIEQAVKDAPDKTRQLKQAEAPTPVQVVEGLDLDKLEERLNKYKLALADLENEAGKVAAQISSHAARRAELPRKISDAQAKLSDVQDRLAKPAAQKVPQVQEAQRTLLLATQQALRAEIDAYQKELAGSDAVNALLRAQQEDTARRIVSLQETVKAWQAAVNARRVREDQRQLAEALRKEKAAADKHPGVAEVRRDNTALVRLRADPGGLTEKQKEIADALADARERKKKLSESFDKLRDMAKEAEAGYLLGVLLRQQRASLPNVRRYRQRAAARRAEISKVRVKLMELNERSLRLTTVTARAEELVAEAEPPVPAAQRQAVTRELEAALNDQKEILQPLRKDYEAYLTSLLELHAAERQLIATAEEFGDFIDERILWIRSTTPLSASTPAQAAAALLWLARPSAWADVAAALWDELASNLVLAVLVLAAFAALILLRRRMVLALRRLGRRASIARSGAGVGTLWALTLTVLLGGTFPALVWFVGWRLSLPRADGVFPFALGKALRTVALVWLPLALMRQLCRPRGLGEAHFRWSADTLRLVRRTMALLIVVSLPLAFLVSVMEWQDVHSHKSALGRLALLALLVVLAVWMARLLRPGGPLLANPPARGGQWIQRTRFVWYPLMTVAPLALAVAAAAGYYYTAVQLSWRLLVQAWIVVALLVLHALLMRWLLIARRRLALRAVAERKKVAEQVQGQGPDRQVAAKAAAEAAKEEFDVVAISAQSQQLVHYLLAALLFIAIWAVWAQVLPALGVLRRVDLWSLSADGEQRMVTLADVGLAIVTVVVTVAAVKNIPGLLEITVLQRLHADAGARYAVSHLARYLIIVVGIVVAFRFIGVRWSHVQWLVAAVTVGLGFGLQEIFGNFVSGLILLFERPIRVGDVVTVGETTGTVTRIRIRATTITNWDRKELVVPNKEFITGRLVNWTLSDNVIRIIVPVGIAYGSDTAKAKEILVRVAKAHPHILKDPEPYAMFLGFGDSALNFELRVYVAGLDNYLAVMSDMHMQVDQEFRKAGIEIAFPQRDVHIRSIKAALPMPGVPARPPGDDKAVEPPKDL